MNNIIVTGMLRDFAERHALTEEAEDAQFEKFVNYSLWKNDHYDTFEFSKVATGTCVGVDGIGIAIGGVLVDDVEEARALTRGQFDARLLFSQAKTSATLDLGEVLKFISTVQNFMLGDFESQPAQLRNAWQVKNVIYSERAAKMRNLPTIELSFAYTGRAQLTPESELLKQVNLQLGRLRTAPYLASDVRWTLCDGEVLSRQYREALNETRRKIVFQRHVALPAIRGAESAYIGVVSCSDYVKLIAGENGQINKGLFFENVRDYLGPANPVNSEIAKTITVADARDQFAILNNGVTVVARKVTPSGDSFELERFQVVNGCQTSHVLFENRDSISPDMFITLKLIQTSDLDLTGRVITTTNSQSTVTKEAFATIRPYHRGLEDFFAAMRASGYAYFYERRPHQFDERNDIRESAIVSAPVLIKAFVSVIREEPHKVHYYYGRLLEEYNANGASELFAEGDYPGVYFAAHHLVAQTRRRLGRVSAGWNYHIALLVARIVAPELKHAERINDKNFLQLLSRIDAGIDAALERALEVVQQTVEYDNQNRIPEVTRALLSALEARPRRHPALSPEIRPPLAILNPGDYLGWVESVSAPEATAMVRFAPHLVPVSGTAVLGLTVGQRVCFRIHHDRTAEVVELPARKG